MRELCTNFFMELFSSRGNDVVRHSVVDEAHWIRVPLHVAHGDAPVSILLINSCDFGENLLGGLPNIGGERAPLGGRRKRVDSPKTRVIGGRDKLGKLCMYIRVCSTLRPERAYRIA